ncbi:MAG: hypothetical protein EA424_12035 [Planctomycetaceae bacterium]|nr:MAG: hypothetical protein EA424_12035 [Planctomycetaceae bacterium]
MFPNPELFRPPSSSPPSTDDLAVWLTDLPESALPPSGSSWMWEAVKEKKLTAYQAREIDAGRGKQLVRGNYVILDRIGHGGMSVVFKARHRQMERIVALKMISPQIAASPQALARFQREVCLAAKLHHPNIVTAYDANQAGGTQFLVMQYVGGVDLATLVRRHGPLSIDQALACLMQVACGLQYAHQLGIVHRDIKPSNLLLDQQGTVKILDMGLARMDSQADDQDPLTETGQILGTVDYMAPEQTVDTGRADPRSDLYSLGATFWYLVTGQSMFAGRTVTGKLLAHQWQPSARLSEVCPDVSQSVEDVFARLVAKNAEDRYPSAAELIEDLKRCISKPEALQPLVAAMEPHGDHDDVSFWLGERPAGCTRSGSPPAPPMDSPIETKAFPEVRVDLQPTPARSFPESDTELRPNEELVQLPISDRRDSSATRWRHPKLLATAAAGAILLLLLSTWLIVRDHEGREVARFRVPDGGSVITQTSAGVPTPILPEKLVPSKDPSTPATDFDWNLPPGSPPPAIAPLDEQRAAQIQQAWADYLGVPVTFTNAIGMEFMLIPPGEFEMGSTEAQVAQMMEQARAADQTDWYIDLLASETPRHRVRITRPFYLGRFEVTQAQYERMMGVNPSQFQGDPNLPVESVSWFDARAFLRKLDELPQDQGPYGRYHLPTEAQWEYACRAGSTTDYSFGDSADILGEYAWYSGNWGGSTHPVGMKLPNAWGLHDMHGSVREWCQDLFCQDYYATSPGIDPTGPASGTQRVYRGGSWDGGPQGRRSAFRNRFPAHDPHGALLGFRVVMSIASD